MELTPSVTAVEKAKDQKRVISGLDDTFGFSLNFISGRGLLSVRDRKLAPFDLRLLELEIPDISFPFDVTGGAERFKSRRCALRHLVLSLSGDALAEALKSASLRSAGFVELKAVTRDGYVLWSGRFAMGDHEADFTFKSALLLRSPQDLAVVFYDARVYGWLPIPARLLPVFLRRALNMPIFQGDMAGAWLCRPVQYFVRSSLPSYGWKIPDTSTVGLIAAEVSRGQIVMAAGVDAEPSMRQLVEREPPKEAVRAAESMFLFHKADEALYRGAIAEAYELLREVEDDERGGRWVRECLLQIGAADPELALETRQLAEEVLAKEPQDVQALLAVASISLREGSFGDAAGRYASLADIARAQKHRFDLLSAELASARAAAPIDPAGALAAYERAAARARDSLVAHQALFDLRSARGDWAGAARAGERLVKLLSDEEKIGETHRLLGQLYRTHLRDMKRARLHFERALRLRPDNPEALEGLAETYAARGEPARAASYLARLAEQAEISGERERIVALNLRLGEIWERWLGDADAATTRYYRVLDVDPRNRTARLRLAELAEAKGELTRARALYEDVLAGEEDADHTEAIGDLVAAYTRLARVTLSSQGTSAEAIACLERAVELDPHNRSAREELSRLLREGGEWGRLVQLLEESAKLSKTPEEAQKARIDAARLELTQRRNRVAAQRHLEAVLDENPAHIEAMELLLPILRTLNETTQLAQRLALAAEKTAEPEWRGTFCLQYALLQQDAGTKKRFLREALNAHPYLLAAAQAQLELVQEGGSPEDEALALSHLAVANDDADASAEAWLAAARLYLEELDHPSSALQALLACLSRKPQSVEAALLLSRHFEQDGAVEKAEGCLEHLTRAPLRENLAAEDLGRVHLRLAYVAHLRGDHHARLGYLRSAWAGGLDSDEVREGLAEALLALERRAELAQLHSEWAKEAERRAAQADDDASTSYLAKADEHSWQAAELWRSIDALDAAELAYRDIVKHALEGPRGSNELAAQAAARIAAIANERHDHHQRCEALEWQLQFATSIDSGALLLELFLARMDAEQIAKAKEVGEQLLAVRADCVPVRLQFASWDLQRGQWRQAYEHLHALVLECSADEFERSRRREVFADAAALAYDLEPNDAATFAAAFAREFPESPPPRWQPLSAEFKDQQRWEDLLSLRELQLAERCNDPNLELKREVAYVLHEHLGRHEQATRYYQEILAYQPDDLAARGSLIDIYRTTQRYNDLAELLFAMSQLAQSSEDAFDYGMQGVELYAEHLRDVEQAKEMLQVLVARELVEPDDARLLAALRRFDMHAEVAQQLELSISQRPAADDERFVELIELLSVTLRDPDRAMAWCERVIEAFPQADEPRRSLLSLAKQDANPGLVQSVLQNWADAREGQARGALLLELAEEQQASGNADAALGSLLGAAEADPESEAVILLLVERFTARSAWSEVAHWLQEYALLAPRGPARDERWRRVIEVATDYANEPRIAIDALRALAEPTDEETRLLAQLYVEAGDAEGLEYLVERADVLGVDVLMEAASRLAAAGDLQNARVFWTLALDADSNVFQQVWDEAAAAFGVCDAQLELAQWRTEYSQNIGDELATPLRLQAVHEFLEAGEPMEEVEARLDLNALFAAVPLDNADVAWMAFEAAGRVNRPQVQEDLSALLMNLLGDSDRRIAELLRWRVERLLDAGHAEQAVEVARRLASIGDERAEQWLEQALSQAGQVEDLIELLSERAKVAQDEEAARLWARIAGLYADAERWTEAADSLSKVPDDDRGLRWGEVAYSVALESGDMQLQATGAALCGDFATEPTLRASWRRKAAKILWWHFGEQDQALRLLYTAADEDPIEADSAHLQAIEYLSQDEELTRQYLEEALAVLSTEADTAELWLMLGAIYAKRNDSTAAVRCLTSCIQLPVQDAAVWAKIGKFADTQNCVDEGLVALRKAFELGGLDYEADYIKTLVDVGAWAEAVDALKECATMHGEGGDQESSAERLERAARIQLDKMDDPEAAIALLEEAVRHYPTLSALRLCFDLACLLQRGSLVAALGEPLLKRMDVQDASRKDVLRAYVDALDGLGLQHESYTSRLELYELGAANGGDMLSLARYFRGQDNQRAADLLEQVNQLPEFAQDAEVALEAALLAHEVGQSSRSIAMLQKAFASGADSVEAHCLGLEVLTGDERWHSARRVVELGGDAEWPQERRAELRVELASACRDLGDLEQARDLLLDARRHARLDGWALHLEEVLASLGDDAGLAALYLEEATTETDLWRGAELVERLQRAAITFRESEAAVQELQTLERLKQLVPADTTISQRVADLAAAMGDKDRFLASAQERLGSLEDPVAKQEHTLKTAAVLRARFEDDAVALAMLISLFEVAPTRNLADAVAEILLQQDETGQLLEVLEQGATVAQGAERTELLQLAAQTATDWLTDNARAYRYYKEILADDLSHNEARGFVLAYAQEQGHFNDQIEVLTALAAREAEGQAAHDLWLQASTVAREDLQDDGLAYEYLKAAAHAAPDQLDTARGLFAAHLNHAKLDDALMMFLGEQLGDDVSLETGVGLATTLKDAGRDADYEQVMLWAVEHFPDSDEAAEFRLAQARASRDIRGLYRELERQLERRELSEESATKLRKEATELALALGDDASALQHFVVLCESPQPEMSWLRHGAELAVQVGDKRKLAQIMGRAAEFRDDIFKVAASTDGDEKVGWLTFLGRANEAASDETGAMGAYAHAVFSVPSSAAVEAQRALERLYRRKGDMERLQELYEHMERGELEPASRAQVSYELGLLWRDQHTDEQKAESYFQKALQADEGYSPARLTYGLLLANKRRYVDALPLLRTEIDAADEETPIEYLLALVECLEETGAAEESLVIYDGLLSRDPERVELHRKRAVVLDGLKQLEEADAAWQAYLEAVEDEAEPDSLGLVHQRMTQGALRKGDKAAALHHAEQAYRGLPDRLDIVATLRALYTQAERWLDAVDLRLREASLSEESGTQAAHYEAAAHIYRQYLSAPDKAAQVLEKAVELKPDDTSSLAVLLDLYRELEDRLKYLVVGERLFGLKDAESFDLEFYKEMAYGYQEAADDKARAKYFYGKALELAPEDIQLRQTYRDLARDTGDYSAFAKIESLCLQQEEDTGEHFQRWLDLSEICVARLKDLPAALQALEHAEKLNPDDPLLMRRKADTYALDSAQYGKAAEIYSSLLKNTPLDADLMRIVARLSGQTGDTDRAYCYYAALLAIAPSDEEARAFVEACRGARPVAPGRILEDGDRIAGIVHSQQAGPLEDLYAPLARFAELTQPGDLPRRGVSDKDKLEKSDLRVQSLLPVVEALGVLDVAFYLWRAGGASCDVELTAPPSVLVGTSLESDDKARQRAFMVARAVELYRSGHTLCERLSSSQLTSMLAALCVAAMPDTQPAGLNVEAERYAGVIGQRMTPQIRDIVVPKAQAYLDAADNLDVAQWRQACLSTASRAALIISCDIEEAVSVLMQMRGFDDLDDEQRLQVLQEAPEELDLIRFSLSESYFKLRQSLGLALRKR